MPNAIYPAHFSLVQAVSLNGWIQGVRSGPHRNVRLQRLLGQQIEIDFVVAIVKEDGLAPIAALGNRMRKPRNHYPSESSNACTIAKYRGIGIMSPYSPKGVDEWGTELRG